jgi:(E)-4-hydroxy-3-methylbut-2-enyl-diphosphate synthase
MVAAARLFRSKCDYPIHIGVTETGPVKQGLMKSAMGIGALLLDGIGDTIRVSLTDDPIEEVYAAKDILKAAGLRKEGVNIISCPTCGRTRIDLIGLVNKVDEALKDCQKPITVAVMGCVVNGPGEAKECDFGIAGGKGEAVLFRHGEIVGKIPEDKIIEALISEIENFKGKKIN